VKVVSRQALPAPKSLKAAEVNALLRAAGRSRHPLRNTAILQMLLQTGMRISECAALNWGDIEFGEKRGKVVIRSGRGNKARSVPLNGSVRQALADYTATLLKIEPTLRAIAAAWPQLADLPHSGRVRRRAV
jgi:site-specific recombinase XerD